MNLDEHHYKIIMEVKKNSRDLLGHCKVPTVRDSDQFNGK